MNKDILSLNNEINITNKTISEIGVKEKYIRKEHYNTIKCWWARRPITAMRSLLLKEISEKSNNLNEFFARELIEELNPDQEYINEFKLKYKPDSVNILDIFSGGGSIPFESARLGFNTFSSELNPVASLLQETIFNSLPIKNYSQKLRNSGYRVIERAKKRIGHYYTFDEGEPYVTFWSKVARCKSCNGFLDLRRIEYLRKKKTRPLGIIEKKGELYLGDVETKEKGRLRKEFICKKCNEVHSFADIKKYCLSHKFSYNPFAVCYNTSNGKLYKLINKEQKKILEHYSEEIKSEISNLEYLIPTGDIKSKSGVINPTIYDLKKPRDYFNERQLLTLLTIIDEIKNEYFHLKNIYDDSEIKQITLGLTSLIEFLIDWNSVSTMWIAQNEQTGRSLAGPGVGMKWDFIEINPFSKKGSNLISKIDRVCDTFEAISINNSVKIIKGSSEKLPVKDNYIDIILTDPPYYDSIDYTGLSEFFRPWFEILIKNTFDKNICLKNNEKEEAIVELAKKSDRNHSHYETIMSNIFKEAKRVLKQHGSILMLYSHKTVEGWEVISKAFSKANLFVAECMPIEMERIARPRAMAYDALNGVIVFKLLKYKKNIKNIDFDINNIKRMLAERNIKESQIGIYLAALAVKKVSLTNIDFFQAYDEVIKIYDIIRINECEQSKFDNITKAYLNARVQKSINEIEPSSLEILEENKLIDSSGLSTLSNLKINEKIKDTLLAKAINIYNMFIFNSKTKFVIDKQDRDSLITFYSIISDFQLNTVYNRSSSTEKKVSRLVLSKISSLA